jgi:hypothetical protein
MSHHPNFPDLFFIFNPVFINSQNTFENFKLICDKLMKNEIKRFWEPSPECFKYNNFVLYFNPSLIKGIHITEKRNV